MGDWRSSALQGRHSHKPVQSHVLEGLSDSFVTFICHELFHELENKERKRRKHCVGPTWWPVLQPSTLWWDFHPRQLPTLVLHHHHHSAASAPSRHCSTF